MSRRDRPELLAILAVAGQAIAYVLSVVLARRLGVAEFEAYAVAASAFILMANVAPQGLEKYGLRLLPVLIEREDWPRARGFVRFGFRRTLLGALLAGVIVAALAGRLPSIPPGVRLAVLVSCLVTPVGALVHFAFETLSAAGREIRAAVAFRAAAPAVTLAAFGLASATSLPLTGAVAAACWGVGWVSALAMLAAELRRALPAQVWSAPPLAEGARWAAEARPFWVYRIALGLMAQAGVIALDRLQPSSAAVGAYAAAMATASLPLVLVTATNRAYARRLSILLERREFEAIVTLRRQRLQWLAPAIAVFILAAFIWTRPLLALFRPEFVADGTAPLRILAVATAVSMLFALSPTYLKISRRNRATFVTVACGAAAQVLLLLLLLPRFGATGAAIAYAVSTIGMYGAFALMAHQPI